MVALFGVGLIGAAIHDALHARASFADARLPFSWTPGAEQDAQAKDVAARARALLGQAGDGASLTVVWSAGRCGFSAAAADVEQELASFRVVLGLAGELAEAPGVVPVRFHLISSAGGLFDGAGYVTPATEPAPQRPYGRLKQQQEALLAARPGVAATIHRPTSVYGVPRKDERRGLVQTLLERAVRHEVSTIYGELSTLRDYVRVDDLGAFVAERVLGPEPAGGPFVLGSGKPSSIHEVIRLIEGALRRRIYVSLIPAPGGGGDITFSARLHPPGWSPVGLEAGVRDLHARWAATGPPYVSRPRA